LAGFLLKSTSEPLCSCQFHCIDSCWVDWIAEKWHFKPLVWGWEDGYSVFTGCDWLIGVIKFFKKTVVKIINTLEEWLFQALSLFPTDTMTIWCSFCLFFSVSLPTQPPTFPPTIPPAKEGKRMI
jgi:hypothetical protein